MEFDDSPLPVHLTTSWVVQNLLVNLYFIMLSSLMNFHKQPAFKPSVFLPDSLGTNPQAGYKSNSDQCLVEQSTTSQSNFEFTIHLPTSSQTS
jgi:hypothetical protein